MRIEHFLSAKLFIGVSLIVIAGCSQPSLSDKNSRLPVVEKNTESQMDEVANSQPINQTCPRSGKPVSNDSLTIYRGHTVGFCNTHCRDDFAANVNDRPDDRSVFDKLIEDLKL